MISAKVEGSSSCSMRYLVVMFLDFELKSADEKMIGRLKANELIDIFGFSLDFVDSDIVRDDVILSGKIYPRFCLRYSIR